MRCSCITTLDELADHKDEWEGLRSTCGGAVFSSYRLSVLWLEAFNEMVTPRVLLIWDRGELIGLAPFYSRSQRTGGIPVKMLSLIGQGGEFGFNNVGILVDQERPDAMDEIIRGMKRLDWNILKASCMEDNSQVQKFMSSTRSAWSTQDLPSLEAIACPLPPNGEIISGFGKKTRSNIHNRMNKLAAEGGADLRAVKASDIGRAVDEYARQHLERWDQRGGSIFQDGKNIEFLKQAMEISLIDGFGFAYELVSGDQVAAQSFGFLEGDLARGYMMGMNNAFSKYSPGLLLMVMLMEDLRSQGVRVVDTGAGTEGYKQHLGGYRVPLVGCQATRGALSLLSRMAGSPAAQRIDAALGLKRRWFDGIYD